MNKPVAPRVGIGMPVYNAEGTVRKAIDSILGQSHADFVLYISDNCSTDGTEGICRSYAAGDETHPIHQAERQYRRPCQLTVRS